MSHVYHKSEKGYFFIDNVRVSEDRYHESRKRSEATATQRRENGKFVSGRNAQPPVRPFEEEEEPEEEERETRFRIRGTARPRSKSNARTPDLETAHYVETGDEIGNIDEQEELLNEKYPDWIHFDTYLEPIE